MTESLPTEQTQPSRDNLLVYNLFTHDSVLQAGIASGYAESYARTSEFMDKVKSPAFQERIRKHAIAHDIIDLPNIYRLETNAIREAIRQGEEDPNTLISNLGKLKHTIKQKKQIAGILQSDVPAQAPVIRVDNIQNLMLQLHQDAPTIDVTPDHNMQGNSHD